MSAITICLLTARTGTADYERITIGLGALRDGMRGARIYDCRVFWVLVCLPARQARAILITSRYAQ